MGVWAKEWKQKLASTKALLPAGGPIFRSGNWDIRGMPGVPDDLHDAIRAAYSTYLLWRTAVIAATNRQVEVFNVLLKQRRLENTLLADTFHELTGSEQGFDHDGKKIVTDRAKIDTLMYQLVEEYCTKNYQDGILYTLWGHIQRGGRDSPRPETGRPRCSAQAQNGLWLLQLEVPLLMMPVEHALQQEEPFRRFKHLTQVFNQRAKVSVGVKHVRFKVENSRWDVECIGHFPSSVSLSVTPITTEGSGVTMTNSSSNVLYKIGKLERIQVGTSASDGTTKGLTAGMATSAAVGMSSTMKSKPWRFEQLPLEDDRGGSFVWTLQAMKGVVFDRSNPLRVAERSTSIWRFGKRVPGNPMDDLPFTSEGGVIFSSTEFDDTMIWRFPKHMEGTKLRWSIEGRIHSTYTTTRYFETRMAIFCGDIDEKLKAMEVKDKNGYVKAPKDGKAEKGDKGKDKVEKGEKERKSEKEKAKEAIDLQDPEFLEWLEFKKFKSRLSKKSKIENVGDELGAENEEKKEKKAKSLVLDKDESPQRGRPESSDLIDVGETSAPNGGMVVSIERENSNRAPEVWTRRIERESFEGDGSAIGTADSTSRSLNTTQRIAGLSGRG